MLADLQASGIQPGQVTDVIITHAHGDHIGGCKAFDDALQAPQGTRILIQIAPHSGRLKDLLIRRGRRLQHLRLAHPKAFGSLPLEFVRPLARPEL
jgi:glyoxylase-like metal-dependent hydrolase (beta-lactamase superfamily II)